MSTTDRTGNGITRFSIARTGQTTEVDELNYEDTVLANLEAFADAAAGVAPYPFSREEKIGNVRCGVKLRRWLYMS